MAYKIKEASPRSGMIDEDELLSRKDRILLFIEENRTTIIIGIVLAIVVAVAMGGLVWLERQNTEKALFLEGKAQLLYHNRPPDKPEQTKENLTQAAELYRQILEEYPRSSSARRALFFLGNTQMDQNDLDGATKTYEQFIEQYPNDEILLGIVYQRLGYAQLLNGNQDAAYAAFSKVLDLAQAVNKDHVLYEFAKLEEANDHKQEALAKYRQLIDQYPNSPYINEASLRVKILDPEEAPPAEEEGTEKSGETDTGGEGTDPPSAESPDENLTKEKEDASK